MSATTLELTETDLLAVVGEHRNPSIPSPLAAALNRLPLVQHMVLVARCGLGVPACDQEETARILGITSGEVKQLEEAARKALTRHRQNR